VCVCVYVCTYACVYVCRRDSTISIAATQTTFRPSSNPMNSLVIDQMSLTPLSSPNRQKKPNNNTNNRMINKYLSSFGWWIREYRFFRLQSHWITWPVIFISTGCVESCVSQNQPFMGVSKWERERKNSCLYVCYICFFFISVSVPLCLCLLNMLRNGPTLLEP